MKTREYQELRKKDVKELEQLVEEQRTELLNMRFSHSTGALEDTSRLDLLKRDIARTLTLIREKRAEVATEASA